MTVAVDVHGTDVWQALDEALDLGGLRPKLAEDVEVVRFATRWGSGYTMVKNPRGPTYVRFSDEDGATLALLDGTRTVRELVVERLRQSDALEIDAVVDLVAMLQEAGFLTDGWVDAYALVEQRTSSGADRFARRMRKVFREQTIQIKHVHEIVDFIYRWGGKWLFTPWAHLVFLTLFFGGTALFYLDVHDRHFAISTDALATSFGLLFLFDLTATVIHELGHGLAVRHAGRRLLSAGFQLYLGHPAFFVDASDVMLAPPRDRIRQAWYGPYSEFVIAGLCGGLVWFFPHAGSAQLLFDLAVLSYLGAVLNLIPFLELDGYWVVMDALQTTDLRPRSLAFLRHELPDRIRDRERLNRFEWALVAFGFFGVVFTILALYTSYFFWKPVFGRFIDKMWHGGPVKQVLLVLIGVFILGPLVHWLSEIVGGLVRRSRHLRRRLKFRTELGWRREAGAAISDLPLMRALPLGVLNELAGRVAMRRVAAGDVIVRQGDSATEFFIIRSGRVRVVDETPGGDEDVLRSMGPGESFGELALLQSTPRTATVRAEQDVELFVLDKGSFDRMLADTVRAPEMAASVSALTDVWSMPPFRHLSSQEAQAVASEGTWTALPAETDVVTQGEAGDAFYVVAAGRLVVQEGAVTARELGPGDYFGEVALLLDVPRTATVRSRTPVRLFRLDRAAFRSIVAGSFRTGALRVTVADLAIQERT